MKRNVNRQKQTLQASEYSIMWTIVIQKWYDKPRIPNDQSILMWFFHIIEHLLNL